MSADPTLRRRVYDLLVMGVYGHPGGRVFDIFMVVLIIANVIAVTLETVSGIGIRYREAFFRFEIFSIAVFTVEYLARVWVVAEPPSGRVQGVWRARLRYMITPLAIIDLLAFLPFYLFFFIGPDLRFLRIFRLVRLFKLVRFSPALMSLARVIYAERRALAAALIVMLGLLFLAASSMHYVERDAQPEAFGSIPSSLWWAVVTLTTVGYGDVVPVTAAGRFIGALTMLFGLAVYAIPIGIVASAFSSEIHRRDFVVRYGLVARVPLFEDLAPDVISEISRMLRSISVQAGTVISHKGEVADGLYILVSGKAEAEVDGRRFTIHPGGFFGEISLLRATFREVTVTALTKCRLMLLESRDFRQLLTLRPEIRPRLDELVSRHLDAFVESGELTQEEREEILVSHRRRFDGETPGEGEPST